MKEESEMGHYHHWQFECDECFKVVNSHHGNLKKAISLVCNESSKGWIFKNGKYFCDTCKPSDAPASGCLNRLRKNILKCYGRGFR